MHRFSLWQRLTQGVKQCFHRPDWPTFVGLDPERIMTADVTDRFHAKQGRSTGRWVIHNGHKTLSVYLKRHRRLPWWQRLMATLRPQTAWSPGLSEWQHLNWAKEQGVPVPAPVAAGEFIGPWFRLQSFLAVEELHGMIPLNEAVPLAQKNLADETFRKWKREIIREMARISRLLHSARHYHKDLYLSHFYIAREDTKNDSITPMRGRIFLIDFHRLAHHSVIWRRWQIKDLAELLFSSYLPGITNRDRLRFFCDYVKDVDPVARRRLLQVVDQKASRYLRHNEKRRAA